MAGFRHRPIEIDLGDRRVQHTQLPLDAIEGDGFQLILDLWNRKRGERLLPARADFDPFELKPVLSRLLLIEVTDDPPDFRYRLAGTATRDLTGMELTGHSVLDVVPMQHARMIWNSLCTMLEERQPQYVQVSLISREGEPLSYRILRLPLGADGQTVDMILVVQDHGSLLPFLRKMFERELLAQGKPIRPL